MRHQKYLLFFIFFLCCVPLVWSGSLEDLKNKLNVKNETAQQKQNDYSKGERFRINSVSKKAMGNTYYVNRPNTKYTTKVYAVNVVFKIKKLNPGEKLYCPEIFKVYLYDKNKNLVTTLSQYYIRMSTSYVSNFKDFKVNKTYQLVFTTDFETCKNSKTYIAVVGTAGEEVVAKLHGRGNIEEFNFNEKSYLAN